MLKAIRDRYRRFEECQLAKLSPLERADVVAFDAALKRRLWPALGIFVLLWVSSAVLLAQLVPKIPLHESLLGTFILLIATAFGMMSAWFGHARYKGPLLKAAAITVLLAVLGAISGAISASLIGGRGWDGILSLVHRTGSSVLIAGLIAGFVYAVFMVSIVQYRRRQLQQRNAELEAQAKEDRLVRSLTDAKLKLMQAQVEPHFLFNTLASVKQLAEPRAPEAAALTGNLITFLRAGLTGLRGDQATLGAELDMAMAYLEIMKTRMGDRLTVSADVAPELREVSLPPAMLITLVENAIKHGLEPSPRGGRIHIAATRTDGELQVSVSDTGMGMSDQPGAGVGLANIRERLHALFRDAARLELAENAPQGFVARMVLPVENRVN